MALRRAWPCWALWRTPLVLDPSTLGGSQVPAQPGQFNYLARPSQNVKKTTLEM